MDYDYAKGQDEEIVKYIKNDPRTKAFKNILLDKYDLTNDEADILSAKVLSDASKFSQMKNHMDNELERGRNSIFMADPVKNRKLLRKKSKSSKPKRKTCRCK